VLSPQEDSRSERVMHVRGCLSMREAGSQVSLLYETLRNSSGSSPNSCGSSAKLDGGKGDEGELGQFELEGTSYLFLETSIDDKEESIRIAGGMTLSSLHGMIC